MSDKAAVNYPPLWLPHDLWAEIARFLDNDDLAKFRQLCKTTQFVGSHAAVLQPLYNRLYAIDKTLPPLLPQEDTLIAFQQAFEKIKRCQESEIIYLTTHHPERIPKLEYPQMLQTISVASLKSLEAREAILNNINSKIIEAKIDPVSTILNLSNAGITRLPITLFQSPGYTHFWQNLIGLYCNRNALTTLNVQGLPALQHLYCHDNQLTLLNVQGLAVLQQLFCSRNRLTSLNVRGLSQLQILDLGENQITGLTLMGLPSLKTLFCSDNQLTMLNVQGLSALNFLLCDRNPLKTLILTGVHAGTKNNYAELERSLLFKKLSQSISREARQAIITRLGVDYTYANCLKYCPVYAVKLFASDSVNVLTKVASTVLSQTLTYLPSLGPRKRPLDETEIQIEDLSDNTSNEPAFKRVKKS